MKSLLIAVIAALLGSTFSLAMVGQAQSTKTPSAVAYVSNSRIVSESAHGRSEAARVQRITQQKAAELQMKQQALEATRREMATTTDATKRSTLAQQEITQRTELERATAQTQVEFQNLQREVNNDLLTRVRAILDDMMKSQNYQLVLNSDSSLVWFSPELDLTAAVIARMNAQQ